MGVALAPTWMWALRWRREVYGSARLAPGHVEPMHRPEPRRWGSGTGTGHPYAAATMIWQASRPTATLMRRVRFSMLVLVALFLAHDAIFVAQNGIGDGFAAAMRRGGHDGYWSAYMLLVGIAGTAVVAITTVRFGRRRLRLAIPGTLDRDPSFEAGSLQPARSAPSYRRELLGLWVRLFVVVLVAYVIQENLEHATHDHLPGVGVLVGPENPLALPALAVVTLLLAVLGALVRWRIAVLDERLARAVAGGPRPATPRATHPAAGAWIAGAVCAHHWTIARQDPGRAPPLVPRVA